MQCVNICRMVSSNLSFDMKYCACALIAFLAGTISMAVDYIYAATVVTSKNLLISSSNAVRTSSVAEWIVFGVRGVRLKCDGTR